MSGRSAYVRKKKTEPKTGARTGSRGTHSVGSSEQDDSFPEFPMPQQGPVPVGTGVGTTNARFLKFSEPARESPVEHIASMRNMSTPSVGSHSNGSSSDGRRDGMPSYSGHVDEYAYARFRRPTTKTEDVSGIEKSGLRSKLDKKSEDVRKGLAKTFTFRKKDKNGLRSPDKLSDYRPESSATVRQHHYVPELEHNLHDAYNAGPDAMQMQMQAQYQHQQHQFQQQYAAEQWDAGITSPPPSGRLPPIPQPLSTLPPIKRWVGFGRPTQRWNKLRKDPELWDPNGDVLVFFGHKGQMPRPNPSFRLSSHIIESTESRYLLTLLREGSTEEDFSMPMDPAGAPPMLGGHGGRGHMLGYGMGRGGQPTPPISEDASLGEADGQISYEMYFPTPTNTSKVEQLRHQITTRNVFALLYHASLVGLSLYQALSDLHERLDSYLLPENDNVGMIIHYLQARGIDDVRNDPEAAVSLLAWSEGVQIRWDEGWQEAFVHSAGMYNQLERCADFKHTTQISRALLDRANLETNVRVQKAEDRLVEFQYNDLWPTTGPASNGPAKAAADRLQKFFLAHYSRVFGCWPPSPPSSSQQSVHSQPVSPVDSEGEDQEIWLTRTIAQMLQKDFGALYDYLVNRDIIWDGSETRAGRKWMMVSEAGNRAFEPDLPDLPMTDMFVEFDNKQRFPHIPHPYPLVPESIPPMLNLAKESSGGGGGMFKSSSKKDKNGNGNGNGATSARMRNFEQQVRLAYSVATNTDVLGSDLAQSDLVDAFVKFERADLVGEVDPAVARRGRWVLIYGTLQTLASVSVDWPAVRHKDDVPYHLSPRLKATKIPPWRHNGPTPDEASHELSHCWVTARLWNLPPHMSSSGADSSGGSGNTSPVVGNNSRNRAGGWPRPPPSVSHSSAAGYHTPGTRSVRSSSSVPPYSRAPSIISESDAASSIRSPPSTRPPTSSSAGAAARMRSRDKFGGGPGGPGSLRSAATFGGHGYWHQQHDDRDMPARRRDFAAGSDSGYSMGRSNTGPPSSAGSHQVQHLPLSASISGSGGFLALDDMVEGSTQSRSGTSMSMRQPRSTPILGRDDSDAGPMIRDFDALDVIDDAEP